MAPVVVTGEVDDELAAVRALNARLRGATPPDRTRLEELRQRATLRYVEGAEEWTREHVGRAMTADELERVIGPDPHGLGGRLRP